MQKLIVYHNRRYFFALFHVFKTVLSDCNTKEISIY